MTTVATARKPAIDKEATPSTDVADVVIIGAGFSGMYALHRLRNHYRVVCFEAGDGVGGTWYWNRYPGARVDIESMQYSYGFDADLQEEWKWPELFSAQPELEAYANHVADRFKLRQHIQFSSRVNRLRFDEGENQWHVHTEQGHHVACKYIVAATGSLDATNIPSWPGLESFKGQTYHTSKWPKESVDVSGKRVGLIGTGSSGVQAAPELAQTAQHLYVFQRTPSYSMPSGNKPLDAHYEREWKDNYAERRARMYQSPSAVFLQTKSRPASDYTPEEQERILEAAWNSRSAFQLMMSFNDCLTNRASNDVIAAFARKKIRQIVADPAVAELLCPTYPIGTKRPCLDTGYYEMFNCTNVTLVDVRTNPIVEIIPTGLRTTVSNYDLDIIVFATGFDAMTGSMIRMNITGVGGVDLRDKWHDGPTTYLGTFIAGFPNLFMVHGPGSPSVLAQMISGGEWQVNWIAGVIDEMERDGFNRIDTTPDSEARWSAEIDTAADATLFKSAESWYVGANIDGKPRTFMVYAGGFDTFCRKCTEAQKDGYAGLERTK